MSNEQDPIEEMKRLLEEHEGVCDKRHAEVKQEFKEVRGEFSGALRETKSEFSGALKETKSEFSGALKETKSEFNTALKEIRDVIAGNRAWTLIAIALGVGILGYLQYDTQVAQPQIIFLDAQSILEQRSTDNAEKNIE